MAAEFKAYIRRLQIAPKVEDFEPELDDKNEAKDLELRWAAAASTVLGHTQLALFRHKSWSSGFLAACSASGVLAACREQQDLNRGVVMRGSIVPGDGKHNPVDGDLVNAAAAKSHLWRPAQSQGLGFRGLARLTGAHSFSVT